MTRSQNWFVQLSNLAVGGTGVVYGWMSYFATPGNEFAVVNHPLQPGFQHWHILTAPLLIFGVGWIWSSHVQSHFRRGTRRGRRSGLTLIATLFPMIVSGYALQVSAEETWVNIWMWLHIVTSSVWLFFALVHPWLPTPPPRAEPFES